MLVMGPGTGGLPPEGPVEVIREDPTNADLLFCGTEFGAFASFDRGADWVPLRPGMPTVAVHDLLIHPRDRAPIAATSARFRAATLWPMSRGPDHSLRKCRPSISMSVVATTRPSGARTTAASSPMPTTS